MFTGIIGDIGVVTHWEDRKGGAVSPSSSAQLRLLRIACRQEAASLNYGASIACAGVCLTIIEKGAFSPQDIEYKNGFTAWFEVEAAAETLTTTLVAHWDVGTPINLERALKIGDELGGHLVTGHVDGLATLLQREVVTEQNGQQTSIRFTFEAPKALQAFIAAKGSITLDGTSLTVNNVADNGFSVLIIPHTLKATTWQTRKEGDLIHLEVDLMARYAIRWIENTQNLTHNS